MKTQKEILDIVSEKSGLTKADCEKVIKALEETQTADLLETGKTKTCFGTINIRYRAERVGNNPRTKEKITIPESLGIGVSANKSIKEALANVDKTPYKKEK